MTTTDTATNNDTSAFSGTSYPYYKYINSPSKMGMSGKGSLNALGKDIDGLMNYVQLLVEGTGGASATGQPLGNKYFLKTMGKCTDTSTSDKVDRYIYINNVPMGNIPFISAGLGNFKDFRGLIPGILSDLNVLNPMAMMRAFTTGDEPDCQEITMDTIDIHNEKSTETNYVALSDIKDMDPCLFQNGVNPVTNNKCSEAFTTQEQSMAYPNRPAQMIERIFLTSAGIVGVFFIYRICVINGLIPKK
jgi:hypothetical protein